MKRVLYYLITLIGIIWVQVLANHWLGGSWVSLNVVFLAVLYFGLARGSLVGQLMGCGWGLLTDASSLGVMGLHTLIYAASGYTGGLLRRQLDATKVWTQALFSVGGTVAYLTLYLGLYHFFSPSGSVSWHIAVQPVANAVFAPAEFWLLERWAEAWGIFPLEH